MYVGKNFLSNHYFLMRKIMSGGADFHTKWTEDEYAGLPKHLYPFMESSPINVTLCIWMSTDILKSL